ncbi:MAG: DUF971 domain-containing protein, partial [Bacteroidota bacterium]
NIEGQSLPVVLFSFQEMTMIPTQIKFAADEKTKVEQLALTWDDGHVGYTSLRTLRDHCPCAGCKGETILLKSYEPLPQPELPGKYKLTGAHQVGSYALGISWGDGHSTGLYTWGHLRSLCECEICLARNVEQQVRQ